MLPSPSTGADSTAAISAGSSASPLVRAADDRVHEPCPIQWKGGCVSGRPHPGKAPPPLLASPPQRPWTAFPARLTINGRGRKATSAASEHRVPFTEPQDRMFKRI